MVDRVNRESADNESPRPPTLQAFAHELNSLLDGSLRTLRAARRMTHDALLSAQLETAEQGLAAMSKALERTLLGSDSKAVCATLPTIPAAFDTPHPLGETVRHVVRMLSGLAEESSVAIRVECDREASALDAGPLEPVLRNTIRNAIEACASTPRESAPPSVTVCLRCRGDRLLVDVVDNGPGVTDHTCKTKKPGGHGIGLEVARSVLSGIGGTLELSNIPFGRGAIVRVDIPLARLRRSRAA